MKELISPVILICNILIDKAKLLDTSNCQEILSKLEEAIPTSESSKMYNKQQMAKHIFAMHHNGIKAYIDASPRTSQQIETVFKPLQDAIKVAVSNLQSDFHSTKQSSCFPVVAPTQRGGFLPTNETHQICIGCNHWWIDKLDGNMTMQSTYEQQLLKFNEQKAKNKEAGGSQKRLVPPKDPIPYWYCHCN